MRRGISSAIGTGMVAAAILGVLTACASGQVADPPGARATATDAAADVVSIPMPEFEPWPANDPITEADVEAQRLAAADGAWQTVISTYPDAVRPDIPVEGVVTGSNWIEVLGGCLEAAGVPVDEGRSSPEPDAPVTGLSPAPTTEAQAVAVYACHVAHPNEAHVAPNAAQLGWIYDYLIEYYVPCFEANGISVPPPPSRAEFVAEWPNQGWWPSIDRPTPDPEWDAALTEACVDSDTALLTGLVG
jgi:hypothetical protein